LKSETTHENPKFNMLVNLKELTTHYLD